MRKINYSAFLTLFFVLFLNSASASSEGGGIAINPTTKECAGYWAGDKFTQYNLPSGWKAYYSNGAEYQRYFVSQKGVDSVCKLANQVYKGDPGWTDDPTGITFEEAKSCCQKQGYNFAFENFSNRSYFFKYGSYFESYNDVLEKNNVSYYDVNRPQEVTDFTVKNWDTSQEINKLLFDSGQFSNTKEGDSNIYPADPHKYKGFAKKFDEYRNLKDWTYLYTNSSLKQCTVVTESEMAGGDGKFSPIYTIIPDGWEQNWVNHRFVSDIITTELGKCKFNNGGEEKCCKELGLKYVSSNIGKEAINKLSNKLKGKILLQVESRGEAWYVSPADSKRYSLGKQDDAFNLMRSLGIGISNDNLAKIKIANENLTGQDSDNDGLSDMAEDSIGIDKNNQDSDHDSYKDKDEIINGYNPNGKGKLVLDNNFAKNQAGRILLQVEKHGEAWYVNPDNQLRYFLGRPDDAYNLMRKLGLGISNNDLNKITATISQNDFQPYQTDIINKIIQSRENLGEEEWPVMSWNDKKYGRLYAIICSSPTPMYACSNCMDGGVNYFDARGDYIGNCNSMGPDEIKPPYNCTDLTNLIYQDADYVSAPCDKNK